MSPRRVLVILFAFLVSAVAAKAEPVIVQISTGALAGSGGDIRVFKGIPFAAPPIGPLRWRPPEPPTPWQGVRDATQFGADCMQKRLPDTRATCA